MCKMLLKTVRDVVVVPYAVALAVLNECGKIKTLHVLAFHGFNGNLYTTERERILEMHWGRSCRTVVVLIKFRPI